MLLDELFWKLMTENNFGTVIVAAQQHVQHETHSLHGHAQACNVYLGLSHDLQQSVSNYHSFRDVGLQKTLSWI